MLSFPTSDRRVHVRALVIALVGIVVIAACGSTPTTDPAVAATAGNYTLRTINDTVLPYTVSSTTTSRLDITADTLFIGLDGAFLDITHYRDVDSTGTLLSAENTVGSIQVSGATVTFLIGPQVVAQGTLNGSTLTLSGNGNKSVYTK